MKTGFKSHKKGVMTLFVTAFVLVGIIIAFFTAYMLIRARNIIIHDEVQYYIEIRETGGDVSAYLYSSPEKAPTVMEMFSWIVAGNEEYKDYLNNKEQCEDIERYFELFDKNKGFLDSFCGAHMAVISKERLQDVEIPVPGAGETGALRTKIAFGIGREKGERN